MVRHMSGNPNLPRPRPRIFPAQRMPCWGTALNLPVSNKASTVIPMRVNSQFALSFLLFLSPLARPQNVFPSKSSEASQPLEIRLVRPPLWHDHYLEITITCVNHSKSRIFLPSTPGVKMYSSVTRAKSTLAGCGKIVLSQQFLGRFELCGVFEHLRRDFSCYQAPERSVSAPFKDTTAPTYYVGTTLRIRFRMRTRL